MIKRGTLCTILGLLLLLAALLLTAYNLRRDAAAGDAAELVLERLIPDLPRQESLSQSPTGEGKEEAFVPDYVLNPELPMPEREIDGQSYIGVLDIPALGLSLPIISTWSYPGLQIAPCRYSGSAYLENLVIAGTITAAISRPSRSSSRAMRSRLQTWTGLCSATRSIPLKRFLHTLYPI